MKKILGVTLLVILIMQHKNAIISFLKTHMPVEQLPCFGRKVKTMNPQEVYNKYAPRVVTPETIAGLIDQEIESAKQQITALNEILANLRAERDAVCPPPPVEETPAEESTPEEGQG